MKYRTIKKLNAWLKKYGFELFAYRDKEFAYLYKNDGEYVSVGDGIPYTSFKDFEKIVETKLDYDTDTSTLCFLHELGHYSTWEQFGFIDELLDIAIRKVLEKIDTLFPRLYGFTEKIYHRLPQEYKATMWAVDFINNNRQATMELEKILNN